MRASNVGPTLLLLLASTVVAQTNTENVYTIQTSTPTGTATCFEVCVQEPCYACSATVTDGQMTLPVESLPTPSASDDGQMTLPVESLPPPVGESTSVFVIPRPSPRPSIITDPLLSSIASTTEGIMSIPAGETPESTGEMTLTSTRRPTASSTTTSPAEVSSAAASLPFKRDGTQHLFALGVSGMSVLVGAAWALF